MSSTAVPVLEGSSELPIELWLEVLEQLSSYFDLRRLRRVSRAFATLATSPAVGHLTFCGSSDPEMIARYAAAHMDQSRPERFALHPIFLVATRPTLTSALDEIIVEPTTAEGKPVPLVSIGAAAEEQATDPPVTRAVVAYKTEMPLPEVEIESPTGITVKQVFEAWHDLTAQVIPEGSSFVCDACDTEHEIPAGTTWGVRAVADAMDGGAAGNDPDDVWVPAAAVFVRDRSTAVFYLMQLWEFERSVACSIRKPPRVCSCRLLTTHTSFSLGSGRQVLHRR
jgi:hypothetical protein